VREQRARPKYSVSVDREAAAVVAIDVHGVRELALQQRDSRPLIQLVIGRRQSVPTPRDPAEGWGQGRMSQNVMVKGSEGRGRGSPPLGAGWSGARDTGLPWQFNVRAARRQSRSMQEAKRESGGHDCPSRSESATGLVES
jgi:hypothetical protein